MKFKFAYFEELNGKTLCLFKVKKDDDIDPLNIYNLQPLGLEHLVMGCINFPVLTAKLFKNEEEEKNEEEIEKEVKDLFVAGYFNRLVAAMDCFYIDESGSDVKLRAKEKYFMDLISLREFAGFLSYDIKTEDIIYQNRRKMGYGKLLTFNSIKSIINFITTEMIKYDIQIKKCLDCEKYFIPMYATDYYCQNISPKHPQKSCRQINLQEDLKKETSQLRKKVYNKFRSAYERAKRDDYSLKEIDKRHKALGNFIIADKNFQEQVKQQVKTLQEYFDWLMVKKGEDRK